MNIIHELFTNACEALKTKNKVEFTKLTNDLLELGYSIKLDKDGELELCFVNALTPEERNAHETLHESVYEELTKEPIKEPEVEKEDEPLKQPLTKGNGLTLLGMAAISGGLYLLWRNRRIKAVTDGSYGEGSYPNYWGSVS